MPPCHRAPPRATLPLVLLLLSGPVLADLFDALEYRTVGPTRGGRVTAVAGTPDAPGTFFMGASGGGLWKTEDQGLTWHNVSDGWFGSPSIGDIGIAVNDANIVYVGTGSDGMRSNVIRGDGVYKSIDGGATWRHLGLGRTGHIGAVEIDPTNHNVVWVAAIGQAFEANPERGLYRTRDGGRTWQQVLFVSDEVGIADVELLPGNPDVVYAAAWKMLRRPWTIVSGGTAQEGGIFKSVDGGTTWEKLDRGLPQGLIGKIDLATTPADSRLLYALVEAPGDEGGLYVSRDQGASFEHVSDEAAIRNRPFYYGNLEADPNDPDVLYAMATRNMKSTDGGRTWTRLRPPHGDSHDIWIDPTDSDHYVQGNDGGANVTFNGGRTWTTQFNQPTVEVYTLEVDDAYPYWLYGGQQDNGTTIAVPSMPPFRAQHEQAWLVDAGGCETGPSVPKPGEPDIVYANCKGRFGVFDKRIGTERSHYVGAANMYGHNPKDLRYRFQRVAPVHVSPHDPDVVYHGSQYVHRTADGGRTWTTISPDLTAFEPEYQVISGAPITRDITGEEFYSTLYSLRESPVRAGVIWTGANDGPVHVTRDGGGTWTDVTPEGLPPGGRVDAVEPSPHDPGKAYVSVLRYQLGDWAPYAYRTHDYGRTWTRIADGRNGIPGDEPVRVVREDPVREGLLYAGTELGLYVSFDDGERWMPFRQNLPVVPVTDIKIHRGDLTLSTMGRGFWILDDVTALRDAVLPDPGGEPHLFAPRETVRYRQIHRDDDDFPPDYPAPAALIHYYLPDGASGPVRLEILDEDGAVLRAFANDAAAPPRDDDADAVDMSTNEVRYEAEGELTAVPGINRFRWDMRHRGPWDEDPEDRWDGGPYAAPGAYTVRLTVAGRTLEQPLELVIDPRVPEGGVTVANVRAQEALQLDLLELLSDARRLAARLEALEVELAAAGSASHERLTAVRGLLDELVAKDVTYAQPMLREQIAYLYGMLDNADQAPGQEATDRYRELAARFADVRERARAALASAP